MDEQRIRADHDRPFYWRFRDRTRILLGGSSEDNLFQVPNVEQELNELREVDGDYVRCTLSSRDEGDVWPVTADLKVLNQAYWDRLGAFVQAAHERDIIVQIELWDRFDYARENWQVNPFNPRNNTTYTAAEAGLKEEYPDHPGRFSHPFFRTVPALDNNWVLLPLQQQIVDKLLEVTLVYDNVLYCMDNETREDPRWPAYWTRYIHSAAERAGVTAYTTEMWDEWDITDKMHDRTFLKPDLYNFIDCSQNNQMKGQVHWDNLQARRAQLIEQDMVRPMNNVKVYGSATSKHGNEADGITRFWRAVLGGCAAVRFHRPSGGLGLTDKAKAHLRAARAVTDAIDIPNCMPSNGLLRRRAHNQAYCSADPARSVAAVFFTAGEGGVGIDLSTFKQMPGLRWMACAPGAWRDETPGELSAADGAAQLTPPGEGYWVAVLTPA